MSKNSKHNDGPNRSGLAHLHTQKALSYIDLNAYNGLNGDTIRGIRITRRLSQRQLADKAGVSRSVVQRVEENLPVRSAGLIRICAALGAMPDMLMSNESDSILPHGCQVIRANTTHFRVAYGTRTAPSSVKDLAMVPEEKERYRLAKLGFVSGFIRHIASFAENLGLGAAIIEPAAVEGCGQTSTGQPFFHKHPGVEFVYCLSGPALILFPDSKLLLETGDSVMFPGDTLHNYGRTARQDLQYLPQLLCVWKEDMA